MGKSSVTGSIQLLLGVVTSTVVMAIGTVILTRLMSPAEYGLYSVALIPSLTINLFRDWGVNSAMTRYIADCRVSERDADIHNIIVAGFIFEVAAGSILAFLSLFAANFIGTTIFTRPESVSFISTVSITIFAGSMLVAAQSTFVGFERMELNSFTVICQSLTKTIVGPILVFLGYGVIGAVLGYTLSFLASGIIGAVTVYIVLFRPLKKQRAHRLEISRTLKILLKYGVPLSIASITVGLLTQFYSFLMASFVGDMMIGNYQAAVNFSVLLTFFTIPISTVLFPAFAKLNPKSENQLLKTVFASSVKYTAMLLVPATMATMVLSGPMIYTLFGERYSSAPFFLTLYVMINLFSVFGYLTLGSFLSGVGETGILMRQSILTLLIGLPLGFFLIPTFGIVGVIIANLAVLPSLFWGLYWVLKHYEAKPDLESSARIFVASAVAASATHLLLGFVYTAEWIRLTAGGLVFIVLYLVSAPLIGAITLSDIHNLRTMFSGLSFVSRLIDILLSLIEKIASLHHFRKA